MPNRQEGATVRLKTFRAFSLDEAIAAVEDDLGTNAVILHTRSYRKRLGFFKLIPRTVVEVIASAGGVEEAHTISSPKSPVSADTGRTAQARKAYGLPAEMTSNSESDSHDETLDIDHARTRRLAQALSIREERRNQAQDEREVLFPTEASKGNDSKVGSDLRYVRGANGDLITESRPSASQPVQDSNSPRIERTLDPVSMPVSETPVVEHSASDDELDLIRETVGRVMKNDGLPKAESTPVHSDSLANAYATLIGQELSRDLADGLVEEISKTLPQELLGNPEVVRGAILERLAALVPTSESTSTPQPVDGRPWTIAFVGPTGVGKTTTLAKVASTIALRQDKRVGLVTADTYRVAAVEQLRTYADILSIPLAIAQGPAEMASALETLSDCDVVLVDTPGRSQNDADRLVELRTVIDQANPHEVHLVLSSTASERVLLREAEAFADLRPDRIVLTKLDEAVSFGMLVSVVRKIGRRLSWVTTGQEVPSDIEQATGQRIANMMLGGSVKS